MNKGSCLCKTVEYKVTGVISDCSYCHCSICRKLTGSAFAAYGSVERSDFTWVKGSDNLSFYHPSADTTRSFCSTCGTFLVSEHIQEPEYIFISLGGLDDTDDIEIIYHQYVDSKAKWHKFYDEVTKYPGWLD